ncbi:MAG: phage tail assembly chaperone [Magnetospirillum sp.]|nr:MAG: phage tail assembly chaperone [Magnetospirillum sp.]
MGIACGVLGWPPPVFWSSTPHELFAAIEGYQAANRSPDETDDVEISTATQALYAALKQQEDHDGRG